ncbi:class A beta-lactamase-related serine hydrolase [Streptomyces sp. XM4193]|uniref:serine hydrolase n=1 Tax=Streptomyces sp. XM4193 TaxID=2929782 RepID=UPI001FF95649|nr:serine hydrolase [Streptomyces sp. XM4193]MCK1796655.1 class A beta-lactamase-related serine hydrolase [Streptomyces sp. XM4193]
MSRTTETVASTTALLAEARAELHEGGLAASVLVRDLHTGEELALDPDVEYVSASLVKVPLAAAVLELVRRGELDGGQPVEVEPGRARTPGPTGVSRFLHPARIALADLVYLSLCLSDNAATEALFALVPPARVAELTAGFGLRGFSVRHTIDELSDTPAERFSADESHLAHALAIGSGTRGRGHRVPQLDVSHANSCTARACADLLQALWNPPADCALPAEVARSVRELMAHNVLRHRLAPDFAADASSWSSKTGTLLNLRHEMGVVEHADGRVLAVVVLTESRVPATHQPAAEALMAAVARRLHDHLRQR